jgi:hypothetical protein
MLNGGGCSLCYLEGSGTEAFPDRINLCGHNAICHPREELAAMIDPNSASLSVVRRNLAVMKTECASNEVVRHRFLAQRGLEVLLTWEFSPDSTAGDEKEQSRCRSHAGGKTKSQ